MSEPAIETGKRSPFSIAASMGKEKGKSSTSRRRAKNLTEAIRACQASAKRNGIYDLSDEEFERLIHED
jgi:ribosomal protein S5